MAPPLDRLYVLATELLEAASDALQPDSYDVGEIRTGPPDRQFVSFGPPVADCPQLTVHVAAMRNAQRPMQSGTPIPGTRALPAVPMAIMTVTLFREVSIRRDGSPPAADVLDAEAMDLLIDGMAMNDTLLRKWGVGELFSSLEQEAVNWTPGLQVSAPQGGIAGWTLTIEVQPT